MGRQSEATFAQASQDLAVRAAQAYFDVLAAQDTLALVGAQKAAISEQLAQAKRNFEVGTATITDTHEAQARYDLIIAQEIAAQNDLENKRRALQLITGKEYESLKALRADIRLAPPSLNRRSPRRLSVGTGSGCCLRQPQPPWRWAATSSPRRLIGL